MAWPRPEMNTVPGSRAEVCPALDPLDTSSPTAALGTFFWLVQGALTLNRTPFETLEASPRGLPFAVAVLLLAGISRALGQSVVLFFNHVSPRWFVWALIVGAVEFTTSALVWMTVIRLPLALTVPAAPGFWLVAKVVGLGFAPRLLSVFELIPCAGPTLGRVLQVWTFLATVLGMAVLFDVPPWSPAVLAGIALLLEKLLIRLTGELPERVERWFWRLKSGRRRRFLPTDLVGRLRRRRLK